MAPTRTALNPSLVDEGIVVSRVVSPEQAEILSPEAVRFVADLARRFSARRNELMKLRILNGSHSTLAYLGALRGHRTVADAVADEQLREIATALIRDDMIPTLSPPDGE